ncbi:MAG TPA: hypothetical protein VH274_07270 [Mycobacteriales bacterium]|nr:hypothetical protein [Mycobacteriales bacterium]
MPPSVTLLGPQRRPTLDRVLAALDVRGPIAAVTAGWQERETDDAELMSLLGERGLNLRLHARWMDVLQADPDYARAEREHRVVLDELQQLYLLRLDHALRATYAVAHRTDGHPRIQAIALDDALAVVQQIDEMHLGRIAELRAAFRDAWQPYDREMVVKHREEVAGALLHADCLVVAGGHVGDLLAVLDLFRVADGLPHRIVAWSAGAMALTDRVVLFHDRAAHAPAQAELLDTGLGVAPGFVALPHARRRLRTDDLLRMSVLARRFAPARCLVLDDGVTVDLDAGAPPAQARVIDPDGRIVEVDV